MSRKEIVGVVRADQFSPNHIGNDAAIFQATVEALNHLGCHVKVMTEREFAEATVNESLVFSMGREMRTIDKLLQLEQSGVTVINSPRGVKQCTRETMTRLLMEAHVPHPRSLIVDTASDASCQMHEKYWFPCWLKRGDFHAIHREDVAFVRNAEELRETLHEFQLRGIDRAVINEHLRGDLVKFYGVADTPFFFWFYPFDMHHSKFGLEQINGISKGYAFNVDSLKKICDHAADVLHVNVYGGDCIVDVDGSMQLIDFNDWPSFAPCRGEAAPYIAQVIYNESKKLHINEV